MGQVGPKLDQVGPSWGQVGPKLDQVGPSWGHLGPRLVLCWPKLGLCWVFGSHVGFQNALKIEAKKDLATIELIEDIEKQKETDLACIKNQTTKKLLYLLVKSLKSSSRV